MNALPFIMWYFTHQSWGTRRLLKESLSVQPSTFSLFTKAKASAAADKDANFINPDGDFLLLLLCWWDLLSLLPLWNLVLWDFLRFFQGFWAKNVIFVGRWVTCIRVNSLIILVSSKLFGVLVKWSVFVGPWADGLTAGLRLNLFNSEPVKSVACVPASSFLLSVMTSF